MTERIDHSLATCRPHLLKACDAAFLVNVSQEEKTRHGMRKPISGASTGRHFDWAAKLGSELGA